MSDDIEEQKRRLLEMLAKVTSQCNSLDNVGREILRTSAEAKDSARLDETLVRAAPADNPLTQKYIENATQRWQLFGDLARLVTSDKTGVKSLAAAVSSNTANISIV